MITPSTNQPEDRFDTHVLRRETPPPTPRELEALKTFDALADWVSKITKDADGLVLGLSGTDSVATFLICAEAFKRQKHRLKDELIGIHYGSNYEWKDALDKLPLIRDNATIKIVNLNTEDSPKVGDPTWLHPERHRWGALQTYALDKNFWIVGTQNRKESELGTFSLASTVAVVQPITHLWKSEILKICEALNVPKGLIHSSRCFDGQCGRPTVDASNIELVDQILMVECNELSSEYLQRYDPALVEKLRGYIKETREKYAFKHEVPYKPDASILDGAFKTSLS